MSKRAVKFKGHKIYYKTPLFNHWFLYGYLEGEHIELNVELIKNKKEITGVRIPKPSKDFFIQLGYILQNRK